MTDQCATGTPPPVASPRYPGQVRLFLLGLLVHLTDLIAIVVVEYGIRRFLLEANIVLYRPDAGGIMQPYNTGIDHFLLLALLCTLYLRAMGHYRQRRTVWDETNALGKVFLVAAVVDITLVGINLLPNWHIGSVISWIALCLLIPILRSLTKYGLSSLGLWQIPTVVIGYRENAKHAANELRKDPLLGYQMVGYYRLPSDPEAEDGKSNSGLPVKELDEAAGIELLAPRAPHVVVALEHDQLGELESVMSMLSLRAGDVDVIPPLRGVPLYGMEVDHLFGQEVLLLRSRNNLLRYGPRFAKRVLDLIGASILLILLAPFFLYIGRRIRKEDGGPMFYRQSRVGLDGRDFDCIKFRSMHIEAEAMLMRWKAEDSPVWQEYVANNFKLADDPRVTKIGRLMRRTSLDELPQLINVLKGEMSLVGPRPFLRREMDDYGPGTKLYMRVRPGITGLWQISGRSLTTFRDRATYDEWYIKNWSLWYDCVILFRTVAVVLNKTGSY